MSSAPQHTAPTTGRNRRTGRAVLAGVVAAGLLAAGGGTFAKWSDSEDIAGSTVRAGELSLGAPSATQWEVNGEPIADISSFRAVPGDTVSFTTGSTITAKGDTLKGQLRVQLPAQAQQLFAQAEQSGYGSYDVELATGDRTADDVYEVTAADNGETVTVTGTFKWNGDRTTGQAFANQAIDLSGTKLVLEQK